MLVMKHIDEVLLQLDLPPTGILTQTSAFMGAIKALVKNSVFRSTVAKPSKSFL